MHSMANIHAIESVGPLAAEGAIVEKIGKNLDGISRNESLLVKKTLEAAQDNLKHHSTSQENMRLVL